MGGQVDHNRVFVPSLQILWPTKALKSDWGKYKIPANVENEGNLDTKFTSTFRRAKGRLVKLVRVEPVSQVLRERGGPLCSGSVLHKPHSGQQWRRLFWWRQRIPCLQRLYLLNPRYNMNETWLLGLFKHVFSEQSLPAFRSTTFSFCLRIHYLIIFSFFVFI